MFDDKNNLIESYFDITKENNFDNESNPIHETTCKVVIHYKQKRSNYKS